LHPLRVPKEMFLQPGADVVLTTAQGLNVRLQVVRPNYVNTAVVVSDVPTGRQLTPLVVEYPIEKFGRFREMAYYTSAHPALLSPEVVKHGQNYVHTMLDLAAQRLKERGQTISPAIVDIAERLCVVEHVDHDRFRREDRTTLYNEVYSLFALNELDTFRYSVSSAGAGGMVQMIAPTYQMVRGMHPSVALNPDFVAAAPAGARSSRARRRCIYRFTVRLKSWCPLRSTNEALRRDGHAPKSHDRLRKPGFQINDGDHEAFPQPPPGLFGFCSVR